MKDDVNLRCEQLFGMIDISIIGAGGGGIGPKSEGEDFKLYKEIF